MTHQKARDRWLEIRVFDRTANQALLGLELFLDQLVAVVPAAASWSWDVQRGAWGHGEFVCGLEDRLEVDEVVRVSTEQLRAALRSDEEYFEHARLTADSGVRVTVFDSTFLGLVADADTAHEVARAFERVKVTEPTGVF